MTDALRDRYDVRGNVFDYTNIQIVCRAAESQRLSVSTHVIIDVSCNQLAYPCTHGRRLCANSVTHFADAGLVDGRQTDASHLFWSQTAFIVLCTLPVVQ